MLRVGLTGGIGCGKSTVAAMMRELGCHVFDADQIARQVVEPGQPAYDEIVREFGREILAADGRLDRAEARRHRIRRSGAPGAPKRDRSSTSARATRSRSCEVERDDPAGIGVVEAPLLIESGYYKHLQRLIVVRVHAGAADPATHRSKSGRGMTREQAEARIAAQMSLAEKRRLATDEIDCSGTIEETRRQVTALVAQLKEMAAAPRR